MEYYVYTTKHCNLACRYCDGVNLTHLSDSDGSGPKDISRLVRFIREDLKTRGGERASVVFYGGEPLLNPGFIADFKHMASGVSLNFILHTNGTLLDGVKPELLSGIPYVFVSIDGDAAQHDLNRGIGTYERIMANIRGLRTHYTGQIVARLTVTPEASLLGSVLGIQNTFDHVYWQLENSPQTFDGMDECADRYAHDLSTLAGMWVESLRGGRVVRLIPFQSMVQTIVRGGKNREETLPCGASGCSLVYIDVDGQCYVCDKLVGKPEFCVGNIDKGITHDVKFVHTKIRPECSACSPRYRYWCRGRCLAMLRFYPEEKFEFYCRCTRALVDTIEGIMGQLQPLLDDQQFRQQMLSDDVVGLTEQIP